MESRNSHLSIDIRSYIVGLVEGGFSYTEIIEKAAEKYSRNISRGTISKLYSKFEDTGSVEDLTRPGRPHIYSKQQEQAIVNRVKSDRKLTCADIARSPKMNKMNAHKTTIQNIL